MGFLCKPSHHSQHRLIDRGKPTVIELDFLSTIVPAVQIYMLMVIVIADADPDSDPTNWQRFHGTWTPTEPGTYCLKVEAVDGSDVWHQKKPASVFITVEE